MRINSQPDSRQNDHVNNRNQLSHSVIILLLFIVAFGIRIYHIDRPALDFSPIRQYQNAHIIRGLYYETNDLVPEWKKRIAKLNMERMGFVLEPRIIENASLLGYRIMGAEHLWIPRLLSSVFWIVGGFFLYLIAGRYFSPGISLFSTFFYLFLPYGVLASRSIQPDPLMVMMMLFSIHWVLKYDESPSIINLVTAAIVTAIAVLVKPYCIFIIFGAFFSLAILKMGIWKAVFNRNTLIFTFIIVLPALVYYAYGMLTNVGFLREHAQSSFLPRLLVYPPFWTGWLAMIGDVVGYIVFFLAIIGLLSVKQGRLKTLLLGLWTGYFLFGLSATFQIHTHNYYSMPFIPIAALSISPIAAMVLRPLTSPSLKRLKVLILSGVFSVIIFVLGSVMLKMPLKDMISEHKRELKTAASFVGVSPEFSKFLSDDFEKEIRIAKEIGEHVAHSTNTLFLDPHYGRVIAYHGEFAGLPWPTSQSLYGRGLRGVNMPRVKEDFTPKYIRLLSQGKFIKYSPDFFIITALDEFERQSDLKDFLNANYPTLFQSDDYLVYDLRKMSE